MPLHSCTLARLLLRRNPLSSVLCVSSINPGGSETLCIRRGPGMGERKREYVAWARIVIATLPYKP